MEASRWSLVEDEIKRWEQVLRENLPPPPPLPMQPPRHPDDDEEEPWYYQLERELEADRIAQGLPPPPPPNLDLQGLSWTWTGGVWSPDPPADEPQQAPVAPGGCKVRRRRYVPEPEGQWHWDNATPLAWTDVHLPEGCT